MHRKPTRTPLQSLLPLPGRNSAMAGFSLIEVTLAIGIIAFAFVALFGLLPTGMQTFRASVDATNDITMLQEMNAMVQVTAWTHVDGLDAGRGTGDIYYFDEEGRRTDTKRNPTNTPEVKARRLYQVKLLIEKAYQPGGSKIEMTEARRVVVVIGDIFKPKSLQDFEAVNSVGDLSRSGTSLEVRSRTFVVSRMESETGV